MILFKYAILFLILFQSLVASAVDIERFPPPDFESGYTFPQITTPHPRADLLNALDVAVLLAALSLAAYFVYKKRDRRSIFILTIFSLLYFGFYREGCICSIGAIQNTTLALFDTTYAIPLTAAAFFLLPLIFSLFFGRVFCAGVCPLGAIQDLVLIRPIKVPVWLQHALGLIPYLYLGAAVYFAALKSAFIICQYDPFVSFFRLSGNQSIVIMGISLLAIALFVGRPYCLFLCPYSVLLRFFSQFSQWWVTITPDNCTKCTICEEVCPFGAINPPTPEETLPPSARDRTRLVVLLVLTPVFIALGGWVFSLAGTPFSKMNFTVRLAEQIVLEDSGQLEGVSDASKAFRNTGQPKEELFQKAQLTRDRFTQGGWILGGFIGLVIACKLIALSMFRKRMEYEADRAGCLACARCFSDCPQSKKRARASKAQADRIAIEQ